MEKEAERETLIEQLLNQTSMDKYSAKLGNNAMNNIFHITKELPESEAEWAFKLAENFFENTREYCEVTGSIAEGAAMVRNLKPNRPQEYIEAEADIMCYLGKILKGRSREIIIDLPYAKSFAWIKYEARCMELARLGKLDELLINHEDGNNYLNSKATKEFMDDFKKVRPKNNIFDMPDNLGSLSKQIQGPSFNVSVTYNGDETRWVLPSKDTRFAGMAALIECLGFIQAVYNYLERFYSHIFSEFTKLEKAIETKNEIFNITDIKELAYVVLPTNIEMKNILLQAFWSLLAFINEFLSIIHYISRN